MNGKRDGPSEEMARKPPDFSKNPQSGQNLQGHDFSSSESTNDAQGDDDGEIRPVRSKRTSRKTERQGQFRHGAPPIRELAVPYKPAEESTIRHVHAECALKQSGEKIPLPILTEQYNEIESQRSKDSLSSHVCRHPELSELQKKQKGHY